MGKSQIVRPEIPKERSGGASLSKSRNLPLDRRNRWQAFQPRMAWQID
jgi:hypothetical protein